MTNPTASEVRAEFEKWAGRTYGIGRHTGLPDQYAATGVECAWHAWQASRAQFLAGMEKAEPVGELRLQLDRWDIVGIHSAMLKLKVPSGNYPVYLQPPISAAQGDVSVDVKQTAEYSYGYQQALQDVALRATPADGSLS